MYIYRHPLTSSDNQRSLEYLNKLIKGNIFLTHKHQGGKQGYLNVLLGCSGGLMASSCTHCQQQHFILLFDEATVSVDSHNPVRADLDGWR